MWWVLRNCVIVLRLWWALHWALYPLVGRLSFRWRLWVPCLLYVFAPHPGPPRCVLVPEVLCCFLCEALSMSPAGTHLSFFTCHLIWLTSGETTIESSPCLVRPSGSDSALGWARRPQGTLALTWGSAEVLHLLDSVFFWCLCAPSSEERSLGSRTMHISMRGDWAVEGLGAVSCHANAKGTVLAQVLEHLSPPQCHNILFWEYWGAGKRIHILVFRYK